MNKKDDENYDIQFQMSSEEFQVAVQNAVKGAILDVFVVLLGLILTFVFILSGSRMIISTPGIVWNIFGVLNIAVGLSIFWWSILK